MISYLKKKFSRFTKKKKDKKKKELYNFTIQSAEAYSKELIALFESIFKEPMSQEFWEWKYTHGKYNFALLEKENHIVGHYGGMKRDIIFFGEPEVAVQVCDTMISPRARGGKGGGRRLYQLISTFRETNVGIDKPYFLGYGFPHKRLMRVAELFNVYTQTDLLSEYKWLVQGSATPLQSEELTFEHTNDVNTLWDKVKGEFTERIIGVRDYNYIEYRYLQHPKYKYHLAIAYDEGKCIGIVIGKKEGNIFRLMDVIALEKNYTAMIDFSKALANKLELQEIVFWITASQKHHFEHGNGTVLDTDISVATFTHTNSCTLENIEKRWWLTAGDSDFL